jgi:dephospho-CoA kinase
VVPSTTSSSTSSSSRSSLDRCSEICRERVIALTGGIATGKSTVAKFLRELGQVVLDADDIARELTAPGGAGAVAISKLFGIDLLDAQGALRRDRMREKIYSDARAKKSLEDLMHPLIRQEFCKKLLALTPLPDLIFWEASLIHEAGRSTDFVSVWCTICPPDTQISRLMETRHMSRETAQKALAAQMPAAEKAALSHITINTDASLEDTRLATHEALRGAQRKLTQMCDRGEL